MTIKTKNETSNKLLKIAKQFYKNRDKSHDLDHCLKVKKNSLDLCKSMNISDYNTLFKIETAAILHDVWDHKYVNDTSFIKKQVRDKLLLIYFSEHDIQDIFIIIDNVSFSKEIKQRNSNTSLISNNLNLKHLQQMRDIVSDADKLEMLGKHGIKRIVLYEKHINPKSTIEEYVSKVKHYYSNKIKLLIDENYIKTEHAKFIAIKLINEMDELIDNEKLLIKYIKKNI